MTTAEQTGNTSANAGEATHGVTLTEAAAAKAKALLDQEGRDDLALRIAVQPGGCAGLRYQLFFDDRTLDGDLFRDFDGLTRRGRPDERSLRGGRRDRLRRHHREAGLHHRQPERHGFVRLRRLLQLSRGARHAISWLADSRGDPPEIRTPRERYTVNTVSTTF